MIVRAERASDIQAIAAVVEAAFDGPDEARLVDRLRSDGEAAISLVAEQDGAIVGHILFSRLQAPFRALTLAPLAVAPDRQNAGIGSALVRAGLDRCAAEGWRAVFVLGDPDYYGRFGFDVAQAGGFVSAYAGPHFMMLPLGGELPARAGELRYPDAFAALG